MQVHQNLQTDLIFRKVNKKKKETTKRKEVGNHLISNNLILQFPHEFCHVLPHRTIFFMSKLSIFSFNTYN